MRLACQRLFVVNLELRLIFRIDLLKTKFNFNHLIRKNAVPVLPHIE